MTTEMLTSLAMIGVVGLFGIFLSEVLRRKHIVRNEEARKLVHFLHAMAIIAWAYYLPSYLPIIVAECCALVIVLAEKRFGVLAGLRDIGRVSYGEVLFSVGVIVLCLMEPSYSHFVVVMLHLGIADAAAAVVGLRVKSPKYKVRGHVKSVAGSLACYVASFMIFTSYLWYTQQFSAGNIAIITLAAGVITLIENISLLGTDNLTMPLTAYVVILLIHI